MGAWSRVAALLFLLALSARPSPSPAMDEATATARVEGATCGASTVGARLADELRSHSRRDLGWRAFPGDNAVDLERSARVSKSMDIRYRWRVDGAGRVEAVSEAAKSLCR